MARKEYDRYETDDKLTAYLIKVMGTNYLGGIDGNVLECCAGTSRMASHFPYCFTNDIDFTLNTNFVGDAGESDFWQGLRMLSHDFDWVVTNPPFSQAHKIIPLAYDHARVGIAMLLRLSYLEGATSRNSRGYWLRDHQHKLSELIIFGNPRPSYTGNGRNDSVTTAWAVWLKKPTQTRVTFAIDWRE